jgi:hypothetical protein
MSTPTGGRGKGLEWYLICDDDSNPEFIGEPLKHPQTKAKMLLTRSKLSSSLYEF